ncbi:MAG: hypothetical protein D3903_06005, partial [Candidatus Electrothrix sp. GM3_4]|nr:hypothetical protein [Candidatus Electrothrix sp. GM3_4]
MRYAEFFHLKPVQIALLIVALAGAFLLGRCSGPEPTKEPVQVEQPPLEQSEEKKEPYIIEGIDNIDNIENIEKIEITQPDSTSVIPPFAPAPEFVGPWELDFPKEPALVEQPPFAPPPVPQSAKPNEPNEPEKLDFADQCRERQPDMHCWCYRFPRPIRFVTLEPGSARKKRLDHSGLEHPDAPAEVTKKTEQLPVHF